MFAPDRVVVNLLLAVGAGFQRPTPLRIAAVLSGGILAEYVERLQRRQIDSLAPGTCARYDDVPSSGALVADVRIGSDAFLAAAAHNAVQPAGVCQVASRLPPLTIRTR